MKIAVCLPSFNEASNIQNITRIIDQGLVDFINAHTGFEAIIVNVDSDSSDSTVKLFLETQTTQSKHSIVISGSVGKGRNILEFCSYSLVNDVDLCLMIDTDITSAKRDWVTKLLSPLVDDGAIYVVPVYERSRFEGSSTNHFAFPLIYALSGITVRQPIGGDFAFTRAIAEAVNASELANTDVIKRYGIDIFITMTALSTGKKVVQINLEKKIHSPSFNKLEYMFPQIAAAAVLSSSHILYSGESPHSPVVKPNFLPNQDFAHKNAAQDMKVRAQNTLKSLLNLDWIDNRSILTFIETTKGGTLGEEEMVNAWTGVLASWFKYFSKPSVTISEAERAGKELLPFFVLRATNFWFWSETVEVTDVENTIGKQAELLRSKIHTI